MLEGVLARGDERLAHVILGAYRDGERMDSWSEHFKYGIWEKRLNEALPEWNSLLEPRPESEVFPWDAVETGFERLVELQRKMPGDTSILKEIATPRGRPYGRRSLGRRVRTGNTRL